MNSSLLPTTFVKSILFSIINHSIEISHENFLLTNSVRDIWRYPFYQGNPTLTEMPCPGNFARKLQNDTPSQLLERESERAGKIYIYNTIRACTLSTHSRALSWPGPAPADLLLYYCEAQAARIQSLCAPPARVSIFFLCAARVIPQIRERYMCMGRYNFFEVVLKEKVARIWNLAI